MTRQTNNRSVLAIAAHPDDIEFVMAGTMMRLRDAGWNLHYFNVANGCCGSMDMPPEQIAAVRLEEAQQAAKQVNATFYAPVCNDLEIFYSLPLMRKVLAVVRKAAPSIILTHAPSDYMEDHQNACRLAVFGAFARGVPNFDSDPDAAPIENDIAVYHAHPHGNRTPMRELVTPDFAVDIRELMRQKRDLLTLHASQADWLDATQGMGSYVDSMVQLGHEVGQIVGYEGPAEGWRRHLHMGLAGEQFDPLRDALTSHIIAPKVD